MPLDDPALTATGLWTTVTGSGYYGPGVRRSTTVGNQLSAAIRGQTFGVLVTKQPGGGQIQLRWNGNTQATMSLSAASVQKQQLVTFTLASVQSGTLFDRPHRLRHRRHRRRRRLQDELARQEGGGGAAAFSKTSSPSRASTRTVSPSSNSCASRRRASGFSIRRWSARFSGRAP